MSLTEHAQRRLEDIGDRWQTYRNPEPMLRALEGVASPRKLRLLSVACCELIRPLLTDKASRQALRTARLYADGWATEEERTAALHHAAAVAQGEFAPEAARRTLDAMTIGSVVTMIGKTEDALREDVPRRARRRKVKQVSAWISNEVTQVLRLHEYACAELVREIFGNPIDVVTIEPWLLRWQDGTVVKLAQEIYARPDFSAMPILADALEEAGCTDARVLGHCRTTEPHTRGCWLLDSILGKQ